MGAPRYVVQIEPLSRTVTVGRKESLEKIGLTASRFNWQAPVPAGPISCLAQIRAQHRAVPATVEPLAGERARVIFETLPIGDHARPGRHGLPGRPCHGGRLDRGGRRRLPLPRMVRAERVCVVNDVIRRHFSAIASRRSSAAVEYAFCASLFCASALPERDFELAFIRESYGLILRACSRASRRSSHLNPRLPTPLSGTLC